MKGFVTLTIINDKSCTTCYAPEAFHKPVLQRLGLAIASEKTVDINDNEGKILITKYHLEKIPTIILQGDVGEYPALVSAWGSVGTKEADGSYVFRKVDIVQQPYINISSGEVITPQKSQ